MSEESPKAKLRRSLKQLPRLNQWVSELVKKFSKEESIFCAFQLVLWVLINFSKEELNLNLSQNVLVNSVQERPNWPILSVLRHRCLNLKEVDKEKFFS